MRKLIHQAFHSNAPRSVTICLNGDFPPIASLCLLACILTVSPLGRLATQTVTALHDFKGLAEGDGRWPTAGLALLGDTLYGTASSGGSHNEGVVFKVRTDGADYTVLHSFSASEYGLPNARLIVSGDTLYGTSSQGGTNGGWGGVFKIKTSDMDFAWLYSFTAPTDNGSFTYTNSDGYGPRAGLALSGSTLYGTASAGGRFGGGTVFRVNTDGSGFANLHTFSATVTDASFALTNADGSAPLADIVLVGDTLYGAAQTGGRAGHGTIFKLKADGTTFTTLHSLTNQQGKFPQAGLLLLGDRLYGTAAQGGASGVGTVFRIGTNGTGFAVLHSFVLAGGIYPHGGLILHSNALHGTTSLGASFQNGGIYRLNTNGTGFTNLHSFPALSEDAPFANVGGAKPEAGLVSAGRFLYGTASRGGGAGLGTIFSFGIPSPRLTIQRLGANMVLTWSTNVAGFVLESATNMVSPPTWTPVSPGPVIANGQNAVTNTLVRAQEYYRLKQ